ncbi:MAG: RluA family pseudouridine synthase [Clostridia bacterium]|nr:RluA family pseudouridine synthase [Clostridia bacterium]
METILYQDEAMIVAVKPAGLVSEHAGGEGMPDRLSAALNRMPESVYPVHRLDRCAGGVMVFGLTKQAAAGLSQAVQMRHFEKRYLAIVLGSVPELEETWKDLLFFDARRRMSFCVDRNRKGVKEAVLHMRGIETKDDLSLIAVRLETGRTHQIRCQCASRGLPILGDGRYGSRVKIPGGAIALWCAEIAFPHPVTGKPQRFVAPPPRQWPWNAFLVPDRQS